MPGVWAGGLCGEGHRAEDVAAPGLLLRQERDHILEVPGVRRARARPRHRLVDVAAARAGHAPEQALDVAAASSEVEVPPTLDPMLLDVQALVTTERYMRDERYRGYDPYDALESPLSGSPDVSVGGVNR